MKILGKHDIAHGCKAAPKRQEHMSMLNAQREQTLQAEASLKINVTVQKMTLDLHNTVDRRKLDCTS